MKIVKVIILNGLSVFIRVITLLGINKAIAFYTGPSSFALISQLQNLITMALVFPSSAVNGATVKFLSENKNDVDEIGKVSKTAFSIMFYFSLFFCVALLFTARIISFYVLKDITYAYIIRLFAMCMFFFSLNSFLLSLFNGKGELKLYVLSNILGNIVTLIFSVVMIVNFKIEGALIAIVTNQVLNVGVTACLLFKTKWFRFKDYIGINNFSYFRKIMHFSLMPIFAALIMPISLTVIRNYIVSSSGWNDAGVWDALWKISNVYLMIITLTLNVYLLPKLASLFERNLIIKEIIKVSGAIVVIMLTIALVTFIFKDVIIKLLFTSEFLKVSDYILYQVSGDFLKMLSWVLAYYMISKSKVNKYILSEVVQWGGFIILCMFMHNKDSISIVMHAYIYSQIIYFLVLFYLFILDLRVNDVK